MFILNESSIDVSLDTINLITLTHYSAKNDLFNIYNTNFDFNENCIPLITSVLELAPYITHAKRYSNINNEALIIIDSISKMPNKSQLQYPSFLHDLQTGGKSMNCIQGYNRKLINSIDNTENNIIIRMYKLEAKSTIFTQYTLNEEELTIIIWSWEYANLQIIINKNTPEYCQIQLNIYITETNTLISSKLDMLNQIIQKINKIMNECFVDAR